jgi:hypothetical protein
MKVQNKVIYKSFDGREYENEIDCKIADINEMLVRFVDDEGYNGMSKSDFGHLLGEHRDTLLAILNGEAIYRTDEELGIK